MWISLPQGFPQVDSHVSNPLNCDNQFRIYRVLSLTVVSSPSLPLLPLLAAGVARSALADIHVAAARLLAKHGGYSAEASDGLLLAAFSDPCQAIAWCCACQAAMLAMVGTGCRV